MFFRSRILSHEQRPSACRALFPDVVSAPTCASLGFSLLFLQERPRNEENHRHRQGTWNQHDPRKWFCREAANGRVDRARHQEHQRRPHQPPFMNMPCFHMTCLQVSGTGRATLALLQLPHSLGRGAIAIGRILRWGRASPVPPRDNPVYHVEAGLFPTIMDYGASEEAQAVRQ